jgi:hypothetical protein
MIRFAIGFLMVFGAVGGMENGTDAQLPAQLALALSGLLLMYFGSNKLQQKF